MHIFIDEAGGFQSTSRESFVSCAAALIVPESLAPALFRAVEKTIRPWSRGGEVKGSQLNEEQMASLIRVVRRYDVLLLPVAIDMGRHTDAGISIHKEIQAGKLVAKAESLPASPLRTTVERWATGVRGLSNQLYVQSVVLNHVVESVVRIATLYYAQRIPKTLGNFAWRIDAKDVTVTRYEQIWREFVEPMLQWQSFTKPMLELREADYSAFARYQDTLPQAPAHLREHVAQPEQPFHYLKINDLLADLEFRASHELLGLQTIDMLAAAVRRACNGTLQRTGWAGLGRLMPQPAHDESCVRFVSLEDSNHDDLPYADIVATWHEETRRILT